MHLLTTAHVRGADDRGVAVSSAKLAGDSLMNCMTGYGRRMQRRTESPAMPRQIGGREKKETDRRRPSGFRPISDYREARLHAS